MLLIPHAGIILRVIRKLQRVTGIQSLTAAQHHSNGAGDGFEGFGLAAAEMTFAGIHGDNQTALFVLFQDSFRSAGTGICFIVHDREKQSVDKRQRLPGQIPIVDRRADQDGIRLGDPLQHRLQIIPDRTDTFGLIAPALAGKTADAVLILQIKQMNELGLGTGLLRSPFRRQKQLMGVPVLSRASIDQYDFDGLHPIQFKL